MDGKGLEGYTVLSLCISHFCHDNYVRFYARIYLESFGPLIILSDLHRYPLYDDSFFGLIKQGILWTN